MAVDERFRDVIRIICEDGRDSRASFIIARQQVAAHVAYARRLLFFLFLITFDATEPAAIQSCRRGISSWRTCPALDRVPRRCCCSSCKRTLPHPAAPCCPWRDGNVNLVPRAHTLARARTRTFSVIYEKISPRANHALMTLLFAMNGND